MASPEADVAMVSATVAAVGVTAIATSQSTGSGLSFLIRIALLADSTPQDVFENVTSRKNQSTGSGLKFLIRTAQVG